VAGRLIVGAILEEEGGKMKPKRTGSVGIRVFAFATILAAMLLVFAAPGAMAADQEDAQ